MMDLEKTNQSDVHWEVANSKNLHPSDDIDGRIGLYCTMCDTVMYAHEEQAKLIRDKPCPICGGLVYWITHHYQPKQI